MRHSWCLIHLTKPTRCTFIDIVLRVLNPATRQKSSSNGNASTFQSTILCTYCPHVVILKTRRIDVTVSVSVVSSQNLLSMISDLKVRGLLLLLIRIPYSKCPRANDCKNIVNALAITISTTELTNIVIAKLMPT